MSRDAPVAVRGGVRQGHSSAAGPLYDGVSHVTAVVHPRVTSAAAAAGTMQLAALSAADGAVAEDGGAGALVRTLTAQIERLSGELERRHRALTRTAEEAAAATVARDAVALAAAGAVNRAADAERRVAAATTALAAAEARAASAAAVASAEREARREATERVGDAARALARSVFARAFVERCARSQLDRECAGLRQAVSRLESDLALARDASAASHRRAGELGSRVRAGRGRRAAATPRCRLGGR